MAKRKQPAECSPYTLSSMLEPLVKGNSWLEYDYSGGVNQAQIASNKKFLQKVAEAEGRQTS
jgi:hypothetical protein